MNRIVLECLGVPITEGDEAAADIEREFREHRPDREGLALLDEFSDCVSAYVTTPFDGELRVISSTTA